MSILVLKDRIFLENPALLFVQPHIAEIDEGVFLHIDDFFSQSGQNIIIADGDRRPRPTR